MFDRERLEWLNGQWIRKLSDEELVERVLPFVVHDVRLLEEGGAQVQIPGPEELRPLIPMIRERMPTLAAAGPLLDFLFVNDLPIEPEMLIPKRWDAATTLAGLTAARATIASAGEVSFEADELGATAAGAGRRPRLEGGRLVHGHSRRGDRQDRHAAAL